MQPDTAARAATRLFGETDSSRKRAQPDRRAFSNHHHPAWRQQMAKALPAPFGEAVCQRLRKFAVIRTNALKKKKDATEHRDELEEQITETASDDLETKKELKAECHSAIHEIKRYDKLAKHVVNQIIETIEGGDNAELFGAMKANPTEESLFNDLDSPVSQGSGSDEEDEVDKDTIDPDER